MHTTLCYIIKDNQYLMLYKDKNPKDPNYLKWLGIGGKCTKGETIDACMIREVKEETGLTLIDYTYRGIVHFKSDTQPNETMHIYTASQFKGSLQSCDEGTLRWIDKDKVLSLPMWEGDHHFLSLLENDYSFFELTLTYHNETLIDVKTHDSRQA